MERREKGQEIRRREREREGKEEKEKGRKEGRRERRKEDGWEVRDTSSTCAQTVDSVKKNQERGSYEPLHDVPPDCSHTLIGMGPKFKVLRTLRMI